MNTFCPTNIDSLQWSIKLHIYYIWMSNVIHNSPTSDLTEYGIEPYIKGTNDTYKFGFLPTNCYDDDTFLFFL